MIVVTVVTAHSLWLLQHLQTQETNVAYTNCKSFQLRLTVARYIDDSWGQMKFQKALQPCDTHGLDLFRNFKAIRLIFLLCAVQHPTSLRWSRVHPLGQITYVFWFEFPLDRLMMFKRFRNKNKRNQSMKGCWECAKLSLTKPFLSGATPTIGKLLGSLVIVGYFRTFGGSTSLFRIRKKNRSAP